MKFLSRWSIKKNLALLVIVSILPALAILLYSGMEQRRALIANAQLEVLLRVHTIAEVQRNVTRPTLQLLSTLALLPEIKTLDAQVSSELFRSILEKNSNYRNIALVDLNGKVLASGLPFSRTNLGDRKHVREALAQKGFAAGEYILTRVGQVTPAFPFAYPVLDSLGRPTAVLTITMNLSFFSRFHDFSLLPEKSFIAITDHQGLRLFYYPPQSTTNPIGQPIKAGAWKRAQREEESGLYEGTGSDGVSRIFAFEKVRLSADSSPYMYIWAAVPEKHLVTPANAAMTRNLLLMFLAATGMLFIAWFIGRKTLLAPISKLMDMTQAFAAGTLDSPSEAPESASELGQLTQSFYAMAAKLKKSTLEWTLAMDAFEDAIYMLNEERHLIRANAAFYKMMKTTPEQAIGRHIIDIAHAEEEKHPCKVCLAQEAWRDFMIIMEADDPENPTGEPIEITGKIIRDSADSATGILMNLHDLTPSRLREQKTRESELKYRLLADYTYDWEAWINPQGDYIYMSPACERITGYTPQEFMTNPKLLFELVHPDYREKIHQHCRDENNPEIPTHLTEFAIMTKNGEECWIEHRCLPVFDEQLNYAGRRINNRDITERKQADQQRLELEEQLCQKYKMEAVGVMASGLAHNFNNNLSIILGNVELAQLKQPANGIAIPLLKNAKTAVLRARDLVQNLLTYSRQGTHEKIPIQLSLVIEETINMLGSTIPSTVKLQPLVSPNGDNIIINADASQIQEILLNLCSNAVHAIEEQGVLTITLDSVELQPRDIPAQFTCLPGPYAKLSIQDSGSGIATDIMEKIFDPFFTTKAVGQGTGMGLSTVRGIVEQHGGLIKVNSTLGQGTTFELYFPAIETKQLDTTLAVQDLPRGSEKILFIDDEEMLANVWSQMLIEYGYQVTTMTDSREALKLFIANADRFDLVITDQTMPEMTGKDLIEQLLKIKPALPTIICTGFSSKVSEEQAKELGASAFLMKPLDLPVLLQTVRQVLDKGEER